MRTARPKRRAFLGDLPRRYGAAARWAFVRLLDGVPVAEIGNGLQENFHLDAGQAGGALRDAQAMLAEIM